LHRIIKAFEEFFKSSTTKENINGRKISTETINVIENFKLEITLKKAILSNIF
jgi:hypothetical protein